MFSIVIVICIFLIYDLSVQVNSMSSIYIWLRDYIRIFTGLMSSIIHNGNVILCM